MVYSMAVPKTYRGVRKLYDDQPDEIKQYFEHVPALITAEMPYDIALVACSPKSVPYVMRVFSSPLGEETFDAEEATQCGTDHQ